MAHPRRRRALLVLLALAVLVLVPPLISLNRFRTELQAKISGSLGRPVTFERTGLRFLPQPALVLRGFAILDDPAFSAEPVLLADTVVARLRLTSLWRGRLEIARLSFFDASLNLVRNDQGRWNIEAMLQRASSVPAAPTSRTKPESVPRFPYIEAEDGRINFKYGVQKKSFSLLEAGFALWLERENQWNMRLEARPMLTSANLSDIGTVRLEGEFVREHGEETEAVPVNLRLRWQNAQLGQLSALLTGHDRGWRGDVDTSATFTGPANDLKIGIATSVSNFRRYDIATSESLRLELSCAARYLRHPQMQRAAAQPAGLTSTCEAPIGDGRLALSATSANGDWRDLELQAFSAQAVPNRELAKFYARMKRDVPADLRATGTFNADLRRTVLGWAGRGRFTELNFTSGVLEQPFSVGNVDLGFENVCRPNCDSPGMQLAPRNAAAVSPRHSNPRKISSATGAATVPAELTVDTIAIPLGGGAPVLASATLSREGFAAHLRGAAALARALPVAKALGLLSRDFAAQATLNLALDLRGRWAGFAEPVATGSAEVRNFSVSGEGFATPLRLVSASVTLEEERISIEKLLGRIEGTDTVFDGRWSMPRECAQPLCSAEFDLRLNQLDLDEFNRLLNPSFRKTDWFALPRRMFGEDKTPAPGFPQIRARGRLTINRLIMKAATASHVSASATIANGTLELAGMKGEILGGRFNGAWNADFSRPAPRYHGEGTLEGVSVEKAAALMRDDWGSGTAGAHYRIHMEGLTARQLAESAEGDFTFAWKNGALRHVTVDGQAFSFSLWTGGGNLNNQTATLDESAMTRAGATLAASGSATFKRELKLTFAGERTDVAISGTLDHPLVEIKPAPAERAASNRDHGTQVRNPR